MSHICNLDFLSRNFPRKVYVVCIFLKSKQNYCICRAEFILLHILFTIFLYFKIFSVGKMFLNGWVCISYPVCLGFLTLLTKRIFTRYFFYIGIYDWPLFSQPNEIFILLFMSLSFDNNKSVLCMPNVSLSSLIFCLSKFGHFMFNVLKIFHSKGIVDVKFSENVLY